LKTDDSAINLPTVSGAGTIILPIIVEGDSFPNGLHTGSPEVAAVATKIPGSAVDLGPGDTPQVVPFTSLTIKAYFDNGKGNELSIYGFDTGTFLTANAIPAGKKLIIKENVSIATTPFILADGAELEVANGATLNIDGGNFSVASNAVFTNNGTVNLDNNWYFDDTAGGTITNNKVITTSTTNATAIEALLALTGNGEIQSGGSVTLSGEKPLLQNLVITGGIFSGSVTNNDTKLFSSVKSGKTIAIGAAGTLALSSDIATIEAAIDNKGTITTATTKSSVLSTIFTAMGGKGNVDASGVVILDADLVIPEETDLTFSGAATLGTGVYDLTVKGSLTTTGNADLVPLGNITITGSLDLGGNDLTIVGNKTLDITSTAEIAGTGGAIKEFAPTAIIKIDGKDGYRLDSANGIEPDDFADALEAINETITALLDPQVTPEASWGITRNVVGLVILNNVNATPIIGIPTGVDNVPPSPTAAVTFLGTTVKTTTYFVESGSSPDIPSTSAFEITSPAGVLNLTDSGYTSSGFDKVGLISFTGFTVENSGLTSPTSTDKFYIGVKTKR
jgi:hypothetical protein